MRVNLEKLQAKRAAAQAQRQQERDYERAARRAALAIAPAHTSRAVIASAQAAAAPIPKQPREEHPYLLAMANGKPCLFWFVAGCRRDYDSAENCTTVKAHENSLDANKGGATKAHDWRSVDACWPCHFAYDQGKDHSYEEKAAAFAAAYGRQLAEWRTTSGDPLAKKKDREAAQWALDRHEYHQGIKGDLS